MLRSGSEVVFDYPRQRLTVAEPGNLRPSGMRAAASVNLEVTGATMGTVADALRGKPGDLRTLVFERNGKQFSLETKAVRFL
jgi:hypothetical protein